MTTTAQPKRMLPEHRGFVAGMCVRLSKEGQRRGFQGRAKTPTAIIIGFPSYAHWPQYVYVRRDGLKSVESWPLSWWRPCNLLRKLLVKGARA